MNSFCKLSSPHTALIQTSSSWASYLTFLNEFAILHGPVTVRVCKHSCWWPLDLEMKNSSRHHHVPEEETQTSNASVCTFSQYISLWALKPKHAKRLGEVFPFFYSHLASAFYSKKYTIVDDYHRTILSNVDISNRKAKKTQKTYLHWISSNSKVQNWFQDFLTSYIGQYLLAQNSSENFKNNCLLNTAPRWQDNRKKKSSSFLKNAVGVVLLPLKHSGREEVTMLSFQGLEGEQEKGRGVTQAKIWLRA